MSGWLFVLVYVFGALHMIPAWYFGKAAGLRDAARIIADEDAEPIDRTAHFLPGDLVHMEVVGECWEEYRNRHGVVIYGPDENGGWIVSSAPGSIRCVASELTMITPREARS